jgi:hypothetical protein
VIAAAEEARPTEHRHIKARTAAAREAEAEVEAKVEAGVEAVE